VSEKKKDRGGCSIVTIICFGIALLPVLYVLSAGPVGTLLNHNLIPMWLAEILVTPLERLGNWSPVFGKFLKWYGELWNW